MGAGSEMGVPGTAGRPMDRRAFMAGMAASIPLAGAARALPSSPDVVVVGAGSAGIGAARRLMAEGIEVLVLEAAGRIGGRAHTDTATFGVPFDRGCSWLQGPADLPHVRLARESGFALVDHTGAHDEFRVDGRPATRAERNGYHAAFGLLDARLSGAGDVPVASLLPADLPYSAEMQTWMATDYAMDMADVSAADVNSYIDYEVDYLVREGLGTLVRGLGRDIPVRLGTPVTAIDWSGRGVRVETPDGAVEAETCIVTVSTGVLASGAIRFTPELPDEQRTAIGDLPMGLLTKVALQFDGERFGLKGNGWLAYAIPQEVPARACYFLTFPTGFDLAVGFIGGAFAREISAAGADAAIDFALGEFAGAVGNGARRHFVKGYMTDWHANPLTLGSYAAARPGRFAARETLRRPVGGGRVFFAGEAVAVPLAALCSGAHLSGEAAAGGAIAYLGAGDACSSCDARGEAKLLKREALQ